MDRTHSIMRIATTASPVSGADVRERMVTMKLRYNMEKSARALARFWHKNRQAKIERALSHRNIFDASVQRAASARRLTREPVGSTANGRLATSLATGGSSATGEVVVSTPTADEGEREQSKSLYRWFSSSSG